MAKQLTTKQRCEKLAKLLESVANKLRTPELGEAIWEKESLAIQTTISQISTLLLRAAKISKEESDKDSDDNWPEILLD